MEKRARSPNYPALSLPDAIEKVAALYRNLHTHAGPREVIAKGMGYNTLNGASATAISALHKYGLVEKQDDDIKVSERALRILHPHSPEEKRQAIVEAATAPLLFAELAERFPGRVPNEELLRNYLVRNGFVPAAAQAVLLAYRETSELVAQEVEGHDSGTIRQGEVHMLSASGLQVAPALGRKTDMSQGDTRLLGRYDFEGGGYIQIVAAGAVDTETALEMAQTMLDLKRKELERGKRKDSSGQTDQPEPEKDSEA